MLELELTPWKCPPPHAPPMLEEPNPNLGIDAAGAD